MATIYKVEIVSHYINYTEKQLTAILENALKERERKKGNDIAIEVKTRS